MGTESEPQPLNIWSKSDEEIGQLMSNFAHTPFALDGVEYASIEAFYACLFIADPARRERVRQMYGVRAKHEIPKLKPPMVVFGTQRARTGSAEHYALIKWAIRAKLRAHPEIARAFVATRPRPIQHETGYADAPNAEFPREVFCSLLTELREEFAGA
jgi:predicted NAD-dependent protein-ADP-ribosyltransferase YbiA (DUF1768 family)